MHESVKQRVSPVTGTRENGTDAGPLLDDPEFARDYLSRCPEAVYVSDPTGRIIDANRAMLELYGARSRRQLRELEPKDLYVDLEIIGRRGELLRRQGVLRNFEFWIRRTDGEVAPVFDTCWLRRNEDGHVLGVVGIMREAVDPAESRELRANDSRFMDPDTGAYRRRYLELQRYKLESARLKWGCLRIRLDLPDGADGGAERGDGEGPDDGDDAEAGETLEVGSGTEGVERASGANGTEHERRRLLMRQLAEFVRKNVRKDALLFRLEESELVLVATLGASGDEKIIARRLARAGAEESPVPFTVGVAFRRPTETVEKVLERAASAESRIPRD